MAYLEASPTYHSVQPLLREAAQIHGLDLQLLKALIAVESGFDAKAVSPKGAMGLMQLIVPTAQRYGLQSDRAGPVERKLLDPRMNIGAGTRYLRDLLALFPGRLDLALAAYNAGEGAVQRAGNQIPNYPETQNYVRTVMQLYQHLKPPPALAASVQPSAGPAVVPETLRTPPPLVGGAVGRGNMLPPRQSALPPPGPFAGTPLH
jgi:soluble lytic murein transglycosylase-like protein